VKNTVAIVTGASQGIGRSTALRLAQDFSSLVLAARNGDALKEVAKAVDQAGVRATRRDRKPHPFLVSPQAKWMTGSAVRMDGGEIKGIQTHLKGATSGQTSSTPFWTTGPGQCSPFRYGLDQGHFSNRKFFNPEINPNLVSKYEYV
jgi:hypothetical protein